MGCHQRKDQLRTRQAQARGLGAAHSGFHHWWVQRLTAIALVPLSLWLVYCFVDLSHSGYYAARAWVSSPTGAIGLILFLIVSGYHGYLGMQVIFEDYIHCHTLRLTSRIGLLFFTSIAIVVGIFSILRQAL